MKRSIVRQWLAYAHETWTQSVNEIDVLQERYISFILPQANRRHCLHRKWRAWQRLRLQTNGFLVVLFLIETRWWWTLLTGKDFHRRERVCVYWVPLANVVLLSELSRLTRNGQQSRRKKARRPLSRLSLSQQSIESPCVLYFVQYDQHLLCVIRHILEWIPTGAYESLQQGR